MKKLFSLLLALALCVSLIPAAFAAGTIFEDVPATHWAASYVARAFHAGVMEGTYYDPDTGRRLF